jgi:diguanylate cyclase (GGDEF)-like protein
VDRTDIPQKQLLAVVDLLTEVVSAGLDRDAVCDLVVQRAMALTNATASVVELLEGDTMVYHKACGTANRAIGLRLPLDSSLSGLCVELRQPLKSDDTSNDPRVDRDATRQVGAVSMVCVPLFHNDEAVGVLKVLSSHKNAFSDVDIGALALLADVIASSMANAEKFSAARHDSRHDQLTGLLNRRVYDQELANEFSRATRYGHPLTLVLFDLDGFKAVNDGQGHPAGDELLREVAVLLKRSARTIDRPFRIGGDEFAILLPATTMQSAEKLVERIRSAVDALDAGVSVSAGMAEAKGFLRAEDFHATADERLYQAKFERKRKAMGAGSV